MQLAGSQPLQQHQQSPDREPVLAQLQGSQTLGVQAGNVTVVQVGGHGAQRWLHLLHC
jgi:hypothetical protein